MLNIDLKAIIFQCSKNYGSLTRATRLKVTSNIADPIILTEKKFVTKWQKNWLAVCSTPEIEY